MSAAARSGAATWRERFIELRVVFSSKPNYTGSGRMGRQHIMTKECPGYTIVPLRGGRLQTGSFEVLVLERRCQGVALRTFRRPLLFDAE